MSGVTLSMREARAVQEYVESGIHGTGVKGGPGIPVDLLNELDSARRKFERRLGEARARRAARPWEGGADG